MKKIWLIRHGETEYNKENRIQGGSIDAPLNAVGKQQAHKMAQALKEKLIGSVVIFASSMQRARQTANFVASAINRDYSHTEQLKEMNYGAFEGELFDEIKTELEVLMHSWASGSTTKSAPMGESPESVRDRCANFIMHQIDHQKADNLVFVLHGRVIRVLLAWFLERDLSKMHHYPHHNANINELHFSDAHFEAVSINEIAHLEKS